MQAADDEEVSCLKNNNNGSQFIEVKQKFHKNMISTYPLVPAHLVICSTIYIYFFLLFQFISSSSFNSFNCNSSEDSLK